MISVKNYQRLAAFVIGASAAFSAVSVAHATHSNVTAKSVGLPTETLITPSYYVGIHASKAGDKNDVKLFVQHRRTRESRVLEGSKHVVSCASEHNGPDCTNHVGYMASADDENIYITHGGRMTITRSGKIHSSESGIWHRGNTAGQ